MHMISYPIIVNLPYVKLFIRHFLYYSWKVSAMVTGEFYTKKDLFPGFGRPFVYYANILQKFVNFTYL